MMSSSYFHSYPYIVSPRRHEASGSAASHSIRTTLLHSHKQSASIANSAFNQARQHPSNRNSTIPSVMSDIRPRAVSFSEFSSLVFIPKANEAESESMWYSTEEKESIRQDLIRDATRMARTMNGTPVRSITPEHLVQCIGLEPFVTPGLARRMGQQKRAHVQAVLLEQRSQRTRGISDLDKLASISRDTSGEMTERSHRLAMGYTQLIGDDE